MPFCLALSCTWGLFGGTKPTNKAAPPMFVLEDRFKCRPEVCAWDCCGYKYCTPFCCPMASKASMLKSSLPDYHNAAAAIKRGNEPALNQIYSKSKNKRMFMEKYTESKREGPEMPHSRVDSYDICCGSDRCAGGGISLCCGDLYCHLPFCINVPLLRLPVHVHSYQLNQAKGKSLVELAEEAGMRLELGPDQQRMVDQERKVMDIRSLEAERDADKRRALDCEAKLAEAHGTINRLNSRVRELEQQKSNEAIGKSDSSPPAYNESVGGTNVSLVDHLRQLGELRQAGALTDEEFSAAKASVLMR